MRLVFATDLHGNISHYEAVFSALRRGEKLLLGGDLMPKGSEFYSSPREQRRFAEEFLAPTLTSLWKELSVESYLIPGNDDWASSLEILRRAEGTNLASDGVCKLGTYLLLAYPYVPITPFAIKDWEKWDLSPGELGRDSGFRSHSGRLEPYTLRSSNSTIAEDMENRSKEVSGSEFIFMSHCPPFDSELDTLVGGEAVGSRAIKNFIESTKPTLSLHGHIHESPQVTGKWCVRLGETLSINPGALSSESYVVVEPESLSLWHSLYGLAQLERTGQ